MRTICNSDDTINSRDLCDRLELLTDTLECDYEDFIDDMFDEMHGTSNDVDEDDAKEELKKSYSFATYLDEQSKNSTRREYESIKEFIDEIESERGYVETHRHGVELINDDYFTEYIENTWCTESPAHQEIWPYNHVDWVAAAKQRRQDFAELSWDGNAYLVERV